MDAGRFRTHVLRTYFTLRLSMGLTALVQSAVRSAGHDAMAPTTLPSMCRS